MKCQILIICSILIFFSNSAFSDVICKGEGAASFGDCPDNKMTRQELYKKMMRLYNKGRGSEAGIIARKHNLTKELYDHHLVSLLNRRQPNEAKKFAEQNNLVDRYNSLLPEYNTMVKRDIAQKQRRQQIAQQQRRQQIAEQQIRQNIYDDYSSGSNQNLSSEDAQYSPGNGAIDVRSGQHMPGVAGGVIDPRNGTFYQKTGGGYVNTRNGQFSPSF